MGHEVKQNDTVTCADGAGTWHGINTAVIPAITCFADTRLDWPVVQYPLSVNKDGLQIPIAGHYVTMRNDISLPLGVVGNEYRIIPNERVYNAMQEIFAGKANLCTAGSLFNCRQIWFLAKLGDGDRVIRGDKYENYLLGSSSHDGSRKLEFRCTNVRVVCNNTLTAAINSTNDCFRIPHSECAEFRIVQAERFYDEVFHGIDKTQAVLELLATRPCTLTTAYDWAAGFLKAASTRSQNQARQVAHLFAEGKGNIGETRYDLLHGLTERFTHGDVVQNATAAWNGDGDDKVELFVSSTFGTNSGRKLAAMACLADDSKFAATVEAGREYNKSFMTTEQAASPNLFRLSLN